MSSDDDIDIERKATLILGYFNQEMIQRIVNAVLAESAMHKERFASAILKLIPEQFSGDLRESIRVWMREMIQRLLYEEPFRVRAETLLRAAIDKHLEPVLDDMVKEAVKETIRAKYGAKIR